MRIPEIVSRAGELLASIALLAMIAGLMYAVRLMHGGIRVYPPATCDELYRLARRPEDSLRVALSRGDCSSQIPRRLR